MDAELDAGVHRGCHATALPAALQPPWYPLDQGAQALCEPLCLARCASLPTGFEAPLLNPCSAAVLLLAPPMRLHAVLHSMAGEW